MADAKIILSAVDQTAAGIASAKGRLAGLSQEAAAIGRSFVAMGAAVSGALAAAGLGSLIGQSADALDRLNDLADATGSTIENLSALENTARRTGSSFEVAQTSLVKLNQALNNAKPGSEQEEVFRRLGLSVAELKRQDPTQVFVSVAQAMARFADDGEKARAAQILFGRSLADVAPLLKDVAERGLEAGTVSKQAAEEADRFGKNMAALRSNVEDVARALTGQLLPGLNRLLELIKSEGWAALFAPNKTQWKIIDAEANAKELRKVGALIDQFQAEADRGSKWHEAQLVKLRARAEELMRVNARIADDLKGAFPGSAALEDRGFVPERPSVGGGGGSVKPDEKLEGYLAKLREAARATQNLTLAEQARIDITEGKLGKLNEAQRQYVLDLAAAVDLARKAQEVVSFGSSAATERMEAAEKRRADVIKLASQSAAGRVDAIVAAMRDATTAATESEAAAAAYGQAMEVLGKQLDDTVPKFEKLTEETSTFAEQAQRNIQDALGNTLERMLEGNFRSIGQMWLDLLRRMAAQAAAARLNEYLFGNGTQGNQGAIGAWFASLFTQRAAGGPVDAGRPYLVGERGPELIVPRTAGTVIPNGKAVGNSFTYAPTINVSGGVDVALVEAMMARERVRVQRMLATA